MQDLQPAVLLQIDSRETKPGPSLRMRPYIDLAPPVAML